MMLVRLKKWPVQVSLHWSQLALPQGLAGSGIGKGNSEISGPPLYH